VSNDNDERRLAGIRKLLRDKTLDSFDSRTVRFLMAQIASRDRRARRPKARIYGATVDIVPDGQPGDRVQVLAEPLWSYLQHVDTGGFLCRELGVLLLPPTGVAPEREEA
jgi:hypothetical protein